MIRINTNNPINTNNKCRSAKTHFGNRRGGYTLIEVMVVVLIFAVLGVLTTRSLALSLRGSRKSESISDVRGNVSYAMNIVERHTRGAMELDCVTSCGTSSCIGSSIFYDDQYGNSASFQCATLGTDTFIASNSALPNNRLTSEGIEIVNCPSVFTCNEGADNVPDSLGINIVAASSGTSGAEGFQTTSATTIFLRNYNIEY